MATILEGLALILVIVLTGLYIVGQVDLLTATALILWSGIDIAIGREADPG